MRTLDMAAQLSGQSARIGWYYVLARLVERRAHALGLAPKPYTATLPQPTQQSLFQALGQLMVDDARMVRDGIYPPMADEGETARRHMGRVQRMFADLPSALERRATRNASTSRSLDGAREVPDYFAQDFHFQTGGYLTEASAKLYDVQVETLFMGSGGLMRRACLPPVFRALAGRDQRQCRLLDVGCGTGRFLRQLRLAFPALHLSGIDLSAAYLAEGHRHLGTLRPVQWLRGNAECLPCADQSQDVVTSIYLFHELPPLVRRTVAREMARVLKPGGTVVFMDSLQMGDRPDWDGMLEAFPVRFHEPYYRHYSTDDLVALFSDVGLKVDRSQSALPFISKRLVFHKPS